ncbi:MAG: IS110 family transposase [Candidatus Micrarchaeota archaeon]
MNYAGLDVHKDFVQACFIDKHGKTLAEKKFETTARGLKHLQNQVHGMRCVMESSTSCYPVYDALKESNVRVRVAHPLKVKAIAYAKTKTDKIDARMLAQLERADLIPESHIPDKLTRKERELVKQHVSLVEHRTAEINKTKALLLKHGVKTPCPDFKTKRALKIAERLAPENAKFLVHQNAELILFLNEQIKSVDACIQEQAEQNADAVLLKTIPGMGWFSALMLSAFIDGVERFPSEAHLASYCGLTPSVYQSGNAPAKTGRMSKQGNSLLRWVLVQDAWAAVMHYPVFRKMFRKKSKKIGVKKAIVCVARKLLKIVFGMLSRRQAFNESLLVGRGRAGSSAKL